MSGDISKKSIRAKLIVEYPSNGRAVLVDYKYFVLAFVLLFEALLSKQEEERQLTMRAVETPASWQLSIDGLDAAEIQMLRHFYRTPKDFSEYADRLLPENTLKLMVACRILHLQKIELIDLEAKKNKTVQFSIPMVESEAGKDLEGSTA